MDDETTNLTHGLTCCDEHAWRAFHENFYQQLHNLARARGVADCDVPEIIQHLGKTFGSSTDRCHGRIEA